MNARSSFSAVPRFSTIVILLVALLVMAPAAGLAAPPSRPADTAPAAAPAPAPDSDFKITLWPFHFPVENQFREITSTSPFYSYVWDSQPAPLAPTGDPGVPFFQVYCRPATGHPNGYTYGWVGNDAANLVAAIDFTPDNTWDGTEDYAALYVKTPAGVRAFRVSVPEQTWGTTAFAATPRAAYVHKSYTFQIPLAALGLAPAAGDRLELAFAAYGTAGGDAIDLSGDCPGGIGDVAKLKDAITHANEQGGSWGINLAEACLYTLTAVHQADPDGYGPVGLPPITGDLSIFGQGSTITRAAGAPAFRLFYVKAGGALALDQLTLSNGLAQGGAGGSSSVGGGGGAAGMGGAIFNAGNMTITSCTLTGNTAQGGQGGGDVGFASWGGGGGGMGGDGQSGAALGGGGGANGGVHGYPTAASGGVGGGGGGSCGSCSGGLGGFGGGGGGAAAGGWGGFGGGGAGGAYADHGGFGGGDGMAFIGGGGAGMGGAIFLHEGALLMRTSTLTGNTARGGNSGVGSMTGAGGSGFGGAIFNNAGMADILACTLAGNSVVGGSSLEAGLAQGGALYVYEGALMTLVLRSSILADTPDGRADCVAQNPAFAVTADDRNLIEHNGIGGSACGTPYLIADPKLGALADNGGPTWTMALASDSPAIDAGEYYFVNADQRGAPRSWNGFADTGAYEAQPNLWLVKSVDDDTADLNQLITYTLIITNSGEFAATGATVSDTLPGGITFAGPITLDPAAAGTVGTLPTAVSDLTIAASARVTVTIPATVTGEGLITNTAELTGGSLGAGFGHRSSVGLAGPCASETRLSSSPNPTIYGQSVTFRSVVTSTCGTPAGAVTFKDGATTLGSAALNASGLARFSTKTLGVGTHTITAQYAGQDAFPPSTSPAVTQTVLPLLRLTNQDQRDPIPAGWIIRYTIRVTNASDITLPLIALTDDLPAGTVFVQADGGGRRVGRQVTWKLTNVPAGAAREVHVQIRTYSTLRGLIMNLARAKAGGATFTVRQYTTVTGPGASAPPAQPPAVEEEVTIE